MSGIFKQMTSFADLGAKRVPYFIPVLVRRVIRGYKSCAKSGRWHWIVICWTPVVWSPKGSQGDKVSRIYIERSCGGRRRGLLCANFLFGIYVEKVSWSPSRGGGDGALSGYLLDASQLGAPLCCIQYIHHYAAYNTFIAWTSEKSKYMQGNTIFYIYTGVTRENARYLDLELCSKSCNWARDGV